MLVPKRKPGGSRGSHAWGAHPRRYRHEQWACTPVRRGRRRRHGGPRDAGTPSPSARTTTRPTSASARWSATTTTCSSPPRGYSDHPHSELEIVTWVLEGALVHTDSNGSRHAHGRGRARAGAVGRARASGTARSPTPGRGAAASSRRGSRRPRAGGEPAYVLGEAPDRHRAGRGADPASRRAGPSPRGRLGQSVTLPARVRRSDSVAARPGPATPPGREPALGASGTESGLVLRLIPRRTRASTSSPRPAAPVAATRRSVTGTRGGGIEERVAPRGRHSGGIRPRRAARRRHRVAGRRTTCTPAGATTSRDVAALPVAHFDPSPRGASRAGQHVVSAGGQRAPRDPRLDLPAGPRRADHGSCVDGCSAIDIG